MAQALFERVDAGPLVSSFQKRSGASSAQTRLAPTSILAVASSAAAPQWAATADLGVLYNRQRAEKFHTRTRIYLDPESGVTVEKAPLYSGVDADTGLQLKAYKEAWVAGETLHQQLLACAQDESALLADIFEPARTWYQSLLSAARGGKLEGNMIDAIWQNSLLVKGTAVHIDLEWHWQQPVRPELVLMRAIYWFLSDLRTCSELPRKLRWRSTRRIMLEVGALLGVQLRAQDIEEFHAFEARFNSAAFGRLHARSRRRIGLMLRLPQQLIKVLLWADGLARRAR